MTITAKRINDDTFEVNEDVLQYLLNVTSLSLKELIPNTTGLVEEKLQATLNEIDKILEEEY